MRTSWGIAGGAAALVALAAHAQPAPDARARLAAAKAESATAQARAERLDRAADRAADAAVQARTAEAAMTARIQAAEADIVAAEARAAIVARQIAQQRSRLAARQGPVARLIAALQSFAARPPLVAIAQPGSVDDLVHVRAVLGAAIPAVQARTADVRADLARSRSLQANAALAASALRDGRARLEQQRLALARLEADHRFRSKALGRDALYESDRAIALGERARDIVGLMDTISADTATQASLATLPGPLPRPGSGGSAAAPVTADGRAPYRLPVAGRIVTGLGEISAAGVRSRGLTLAAKPDARVVAPAAGRIRFAGRFRSYAQVVVIDHGGGWTSALTGLGETDVAVGERVSAGDTVGRAAAGDDPRVTVELRRKGRAVDMTALL